MIHNLMRTLAPLALVAVGSAVAGCAKSEARRHMAAGVPLAELDVSGDAPSGLVLMGSDNVVIRTGERLAVSVAGDEEAKADLRFELARGTLTIHREGRGYSDGKATVTVTMPAPSKLVVAGSGRIDAEALNADKAQVSIAGSGHAETPTVASETLKVEIAGSGSYHAAGSARNLDLSIAGSGDAQLAAVKVDNAKVNIAGSGNSAFASDGAVKAHIVGSGEVRVIGRARCKVQSVGSGRLICETAEG